MGIGEVDADLDLTDKDDYDNDYNVKFEQVLGKIILLAFVFLFAIVQMNLLNAVAIGDIQVKIKPLKVRVFYRLLLQTQCTRPTPFT